MTAPRCLATAQVGPESVAWLTVCVEVKLGKRGPCKEAVPRRVFMLSLHVFANDG